MNKKRNDGRSMLRLVHGKLPRNRGESVKIPLLFYVIHTYVLVEGGARPHPA